LIGALAGAGFLATAGAAQAQTAPTIVGSLANFDVVNETEGEKEGFEIQLEGLEPQDIARVFGQAGATCYIRYCIGTITAYGTPGVAPFGVFVRWTANYDPAAQKFVTPPSAPGNGHGTPSRVGNAQPLPVTGESCWSIGAGAAYAESGCEHFGVSTTAGRFPNAAKTVTYRWLVPDPASPGTLVTPPADVVPPVAISHPIVQGDVLAGAPDVQVVAAAAPPVAPAHRYGKAQWVKVYKTELGRDADLDELVGGHPNDVVPNAENQLGQTETEWKLLQLDVKNPDKGGSRLVGHGTPGGGKHAVLRRYEFYKYAGAVVAPGGTSGGGKNGGPVLSTDDQEASLVCIRAIPGDLTSECVAPGPGEVGDFIGAQMAAQNLGDRVTPLINWPAPASMPYGSALSDAQLNAIASANGSPVAGSYAYTPPAGALLQVGTHTMQVVFTPFDSATFGTQSMTMSITIDPAPLTITAGSGAKVYGAPFTAAAFTASGLIAGDTVNSVTLTTAGAAASSGAGSYDIVPSAALGSGLGNYSISYANGTLTVAPASLSVVADAKTKEAGAVDPALTFAADGFVAGDTAAILTGGLARAAGEAPGTYAINQGTLSAGGNYTIAFTGSTLTITAPPPPPPPPSTVSIAPIAPQTNIDGDEVELHVVLVKSGASALLRKARGPEADELAGHDERGTFAISGLNGLRIDKDGVIEGHIRAGVTSDTLFHVTVSYTLNGATATQQIEWTVKPAPSKRGKG